MEKEALFASLTNSSSSRINLIRDQIINQEENFDSVLSPVVSSPSSYLLESAAGGDSVVITELIGRLGSICNSNEVSCQRQNVDNHPAHFSFTDDPSFVDRAAKYSTFCSNAGQFMLQETGEVRNSCSVNSRKRKSGEKGKGKEVPLSSSITAVTNYPKKAKVRVLNAKRSKSLEESNLNGMNGTNIKPAELAMDYIHVRARRGQATDSHSLAERVRREKISERMKLLQDLVPGCNKVTGKAVMLDEIINYVQLLQRQVEFLSMKLATVHPQLDFNLVTFPAEVNYKLLTTQPEYPMEATSSSFSLANLHEKTSLNSNNGLDLESQLNPLAHQSLNMQLPPMEGFVDTSSQIGAFWDDDLQNAIHMSFIQNQEYHDFTSQSFQH